MELDDLAADIGERNNLANASPAKRDELLDDLLAWIQSTGALLPSQPNPKHDPAARGTKTPKAGRGLPAN